MYPPIVDLIPEERMDLNHDFFLANESARTSRGVLRRRVLTTQYPSIASVQHHTGFIDVPTGGHSMPEPAPVTQLHQNLRSMLRARMSPEEDVDTDESPEISAAAVTEDELLESPGSVVVLNRLGDLEKRQARMEALLEQIVSKL